MAHTRARALTDALEHGRPRTAGNPRTWEPAHLGTREQAHPRTTGSQLLCLAAERAAIRSRVKRLAAVPAEARLWRFARFEPRMDFLLGLVGRGREGRRRARCAPRRRARRRE